MATVHPARSRAARSSRATTVTPRPTPAATTPTAKPSSSARCACTAATTSSAEAASAPQQPAGCRSLVADADHAYEGDVRALRQHARALRAGLAFVGAVVDPVGGAF